MIDIQEIQKVLCKYFCMPISVNAVPCGYAVSIAFEDSSGDRLRFYIIANNGRIRLEDSGDFLSTLKASGIDFGSGRCGMLLNQVLQAAEAYWDQDTFEIRTDEFLEEELPVRMVKFTAALIHLRTPPAGRTAQPVAVRHGT